jgi:itaconyl-CoA hydratase
MSERTDNIVVWLIVDQAGAMRPGWTGRYFEDSAVGDVSHNVMANLGWDEVRLPNPLFEGDTVYSRSEVLEVRQSRSRPAVGIVQVRTTGFNQDSVEVISFRRTVLVYRRGHGPQPPRFPAPH